MPHEVEIQPTEDLGRPESLVNSKANNKSEVKTSCELLSVGRLGSSKMVDPFQKKYLNRSCPT